MPIEKYPPVCNMIRCAAEKGKNKYTLEVLTVFPGKGVQPLAVEGITIRRIGTEKARSRILRAIYYLKFNILSCWILIINRPIKVMYYETLSAFSPWLYKRWFNRNAQIYIHYHEYTTPAEYQKGMVLAQYLNKLEKRNYPYTSWVSHTNENRLKLFLADLGTKLPPITGILPNYPPSKWYDQTILDRNKNDLRIGFVYVGGLSLSTMFTEQAAKCIAAEPETCYWDIYSNNTDQQVMEYFEKLQAPNINFRGAIPYDLLPTILPKYDIGLILHNDSTLNYKYNAPNKFFEYYASGLNVLFPTVLLGMKEFEQTEHKPWTHGIDFKNFKISSLSDTKRSNQSTPLRFVAEEVYDKFLDTILI